jgi:hypothetical protein
MNNRQYDPQRVEAQVMAKLSNSTREEVLFCQQQHIPLNGDALRQVEKTRKEQELAR